MRNLKIETSPTHPDKLEAWVLNKKGFYNFLEYINKEDLETFYKTHSKDEIINKTNLPIYTPPTIQRKRRKNEK